MTWWTRLLRRPHFERALDAELRDHIERHVADAMRLGRREADARREAAVVFGGVEQIKEQCRDARGGRWVESAWRDGVHAVRMLRREPLLATIAIVALSCGIGVNTSLFTAFNAVALRLWPVADADRMVNVYSPYCCEREGGAPNGFSLREVQYFAEHSKTIAGFLLTRQSNDGGRMGDVTTEWVSGNYFRVLGVAMARGRDFAADEGRIGTPQPVVVVSFEYWQNRLGGDPAIVGRPVRLGPLTFTIVGIAPARFSGSSGQRVDAWLPLAAVPLLRPDDGWVREVLQKPDHCCTLVAGRLAAGVSKARAEAELTNLRRQLRPSEVEPDRQRVVLSAFTLLGAAPPFKRAGIGSLFGLMLTAVAMVLLLTCSNVANLLLARAEARRREMSLRMALGASRARVVRQLLTEGLVMATAAGAGGFAIAAWLPAQTIRWLGRDTLALQLGPDTAVLAFTAIVTMAACVLFALAPALQATRPPAAVSLRTSLRSVFLAVQVALSVILLASACLLVRGIQHASAVDRGLTLEGVNVVSLDTSRSLGAGEPTRTVGDQLVGALSGLAPELGPVVATRYVPLMGGGKDRVRLPGSDTVIDVITGEVSGGYFDLLRIPLLAGRDLASGDATYGGIVINETLARGLANGRTPLGQIVILSAGPREVVGVVGDVRSAGPRLDEVEPAVYRPISGPAIPRVLVRADTPAAAAVEALVERLDPRIHTRVTPLSEALDDRLSSSRLGARLAGALGVFAIVLASIGLFGVFAFWVQQRTQELGLRMALGARAPHVIWLVVASAGRASALGLLAGLAGAVVASHALRRYVYGLSPLDPWAYAAVVTILAVAGSAAVYLPARRATRVDPLTALRYE